MRLTSGTVLANALIFAQSNVSRRSMTTGFAALFVGTDGIDGNSLAAGAISDETTLERGRAVGLDAVAALSNSDSHGYLSVVGDDIETSVTGTNVRDVRTSIAKSG